MVYVYILLNYSDWNIPFIVVNIDAYDKQLGAVISQNNKPIVFFLKKMKQTTT